MGAGPDNHAAVQAEEHSDLIPQYGDVVLDASRDDACQSSDRGRTYGQLERVIG